LEAERSGNPDAPVVAVLLNEGVRAKLLPEGTLGVLAEFATVRTLTNRQIDTDDWRHVLRGAKAVITGWHSPGLDMGLLAEHPEVEFAGHTGASIRLFLPYEAIETGRLRVSNAALHIAEAVAEFVIAQIMEHLRRTREQDAALKGGEAWWPARERFTGRLLGGQTVGLVGAGHTGRLVIDLLRPFGCRILVADPYLAPARAADPGVELSSLDEVMAECDIVTLHAPVLDETRGMIGARQMKLLRDGAFLINTARGAIIDDAALLDRLRIGTITAALDVFDTEPLPDDSPFRTAPGIILSPHTAGHTHETHRRQGRTAVDEVRRYLSGEPLRHEVTREMLATMA
jgi:phosphoglycerate dehydrogenase-like enzyme